MNDAELEVATEKVMAGTALTSAGVPYKNSYDTLYEAMLHIAEQPMDLLYKMPEIPHELPEEIKCKQFKAHANGIQKALVYIEYLLRWGVVMLSRILELNPEDLPEVASPEKQDAESFSDSESEVISRRLDGAFAQQDNTQPAFHDLRAAAEPGARPL